MKAKIMGDDIIELDGTPEEILAVISKTHVPAAVVQGPVITGRPVYLPSTTIVADSAENGKAKKPRVKRTKKPKGAGKVHKGTSAAMDGNGDSLKLDEGQESAPPERQAPKRSTHFGKRKKEVKPKAGAWTDRDYESLITDLKNGRKPAAIAATFGVSEATIYNKIKKMRELGKLPKAE